MQAEIPRVASPAMSVLPDGRQLFFWVLAAAVLSLSVFLVGVFVGRRVERRQHEKTDPASLTDALAALDAQANAEEVLTFPRILAGPERAHEAAAAGPSAPQGVDQAAGGAGRYVLLSAGLASKEAAERLASRLRGAGYRPRLVEPAGAQAGGGAAHRVSIGEFTSPEQGQALRGELLRRFELSTVLVKQPSP